MSKSLLEQALEARLREIETEKAQILALLNRDKASDAEKAKTPVKPKRKRRKLSAAGLAALRKAQKARWAKVKAEAG